MAIAPLVTLLAVGCGPEPEVGTSSDDDTTQTDGTSTADTGVDSTGGDDQMATSQTSGDTGVTSDTTGSQTGPGDTTNGSGSESGATTGVIGECASYEDQASCEAAECTWVGDPRLGACLPGVDPTGGNFCEPLGMPMCEAIPACMWDVDMEACVPA